MTATWHTGDVFEVMASLPDGSVDLILTSPPFLALRSYLPADHPDKAKEIGSEANPAAFVDTLMRLTAEWRRLLAPHGSLCVELGDTFAGGGAGRPYALTDGYSGYAYTDNTKIAERPDTDMRGHGWPLPKSLCLIPELYRFSLAYGYNPLNPEHRMLPWRVRNVVRWVRPNPPVGALGDKFRPATSEMVVACVSGSRWFDLEAVREPLSSRAERELAEGRVTSGKTAKHDDGTALSSGRGLGIQNPAGAPPLDWWEIPTHPYKGSHYATFPPDLCVRPIKSMCPERVCRECGRPSERITGEPEYVNNAGRPARYDMSDERLAPGVRQFGVRGDNSAHRVAETLGWTDCGHDAWRPGVVLDPFAGSGTTLMVATGHGRDAIGIDLDPRNQDLARERVGMFLEVA